MKRLIKNIYSLFIQFRFHLRVFLLNLRDEIEVHRKCLVQEGAIIRIWKGGSINIGPGTEIMHGAVILTYGGRIAIGSNCSINPYCILYGHGGLTIGNNVLIAGGSMLIPNNHVYRQPGIPIANQGNISKGIIVEDDVWIGHACSILDGITIGKGSVIAAGSVVNRDVPPYTVFGGVPARFLKKRM